jgi:hypothetical protein
MIKKLLLLLLSEGLFKVCRRVIPIPGFGDFVGRWIYCIDI